LYLESQKNSGNAFFTVTENDEIMAIMSEKFGGVSEPTATSRIMVLKLP